MRMRIALSIITVFLAGTIYLVARSYTLPLVNYVVCYAFLQKAPVEWSPEEIQLIFRRAYQSSLNSPLTKKNYIQELFRLSQKLEKVQHLSREETQILLDTIRDTAKAY